MTYVKAGIIPLDTTIAGQKITNQLSRTFANLKDLIALGYNPLAAWNPSDPITQDMEKTIETIIAANVIHSELANKESDSALLEVF